MEKILLTATLIITLTLTMVSLQTVFLEKSLSPSGSPLEKSQKESSQVPSLPSISTTDSLVAANPLYLQTKKQSLPLTKTLTTKPEKRPGKAGGIQNPPKNQQNPFTHRDFLLILSSPQRDDKLMELVRKENQFSQLALSKMVELKLTHLAPNLRDLYEVRKHSPKRRNLFFDINLLQTIEKLGGYLDDREKKLLRGDGIRSWRMSQ